MKVAETAPPAGSVLNDRKKDPGRGSDIVCESLKSDSSKGTPLTFSRNRPDRDHEAQTDPPRHLWTNIFTFSLFKAEWTSADVPTEDLLVDQKDHFLKFQEKFKLILKQKYLPLVEDLRTQTGHLTEGLSGVVSELLLAPVRGSAPRTVLTRGAAGVGKSVLVHQSIVDWCEGKALLDVHLLCPLPVPQLNLLQNQSRTLQELLELFCPGLRRSGLTDLSHYRVLFILDGLDQCRLKLDFSTRHRRRDAVEPMPVETLLSELMEGNLLPDAQLWITSRTGAFVPPTLIHRDTELHGQRQEVQEVQEEKVVAQVISCSAPSSTNDRSVNRGSDQDTQEVFTPTQRV